MTRKTKIGLLVGLAFIIIVGILLSEPLNHAGDAQPAPLPFAGANVRTGVTSPGAQTIPPPISMQNGGSDAKDRVPTHEEVTKPNGGISIVVSAGPGNPTHTNSPASTPLSNPGDDEAQPPVVHPPVSRGNEVAHGGGHVSTPPPSNGGGDLILQAGHEGGEEIVSVGTHAEPRTNKPKASKQYQAVAGDSLSKIAQKFYGSSAKNFRDAIVAANASMKGDPHKIIMGQTYAIPAVDNAAVVTPAPTPPTVVVQAPAAQKPKPASNENWYTVKPGDNLWAIARDQCGDSGAVPAIKELNKDSLKGADVVKVGMKLRMPNKPLASAT